MQIQTIKSGAVSVPISSSEPQEAVREIQLTGKDKPGQDSVDLSRQGRNLARKSESEFQQALEAKPASASGAAANEQEIPDDYVKMLESLIDDPVRLAEFVRGIFRGSSAAQRIDAAVQSTPSSDGSDTKNEAQKPVVSLEA